MQNALRLKRQLDFSESKESNDPPLAVHVVCDLESHRGGEVLHTTAITANSTANSFATAMARVLLQLDADGRLAADDARLLRRVNAETSREDRLSVVMEPERNFGPFESLPRESQLAIGRAIQHDDWWRMAGDNLGDWYFAMGRLVRRARTKVKGVAFGGKTGFLTEGVQALLQSAPRRGLQEVYRQRLRWQARFVQRPTLAAMLKLADLEPWNFAIGYAGGSPNCRPFAASGMTPLDTIPSE